jgi:hypothetical protein
MNFDFADVTAKSGRHPMLIFFDELQLQFAANLGLKRSIT